MQKTVKVSHLKRKNLSHLKIISAEAIKGVALIIVMLTLTALSNGTTEIGFGSLEVL